MEIVKIVIFFGYVIVKALGNYDIFVRLSATGNRYLRNASYKAFSRRDTDCARTCSAQDYCRSFNFLELNSGKNLCELFKTIPTNIQKEISYIQDSETSAFYEKTCRAPVFVKSAAEDVGDNNTYSVYITYGASDTIYRMAISKNLTSHGKVGHKFNDVPTTTGGYLTSIGSVVVLYVPEISIESPLVWIVEENMVHCQISRPKNVVELCPGRWPRSVEEQTNEIISSVDALLSINGTGLWIFVNNRIHQCSIGDNLRWMIDRVFSVGGNSFENIWAGVPYGITAAAWLDFEKKQDRMIGEETTAILFTRNYFVVYNTTIKEIVYRGHACL